MLSESENLKTYEVRRGKVKVKSSDTKMLQCLLSASRCQRDGQVYIFYLNRIVFAPTIFFVRQRLGQRKGNVLTPERERELPKVKIN